MRLRQLEVTPVPAWPGLVAVESHDIVVMLLVVTGETCPTNVLQHRGGTTGYPSFPEKRKIPDSNLERESRAVEDNLSALNIILHLSSPVLSWLPGGCRCWLIISWAGRK